MKFVLFYHSFVSCWNHGNAHFLRGVVRELVKQNHTVSVWEPEDGWSRTHALQDGGADLLAEAARLVPGAVLHTYRKDMPDLDHALDGADVVIVHEWTAPVLVEAIGRRRQCGAPFTLLFHDTHHRAVTAPDEIERLDIEGYDGVLAFGEVLREIYGRHGWARRAFTWHEAADTALFRPMPQADKPIDLAWIGNWGDEERTRELDDYLIAPAAHLGLKTTVHGVRYPASAQERLRQAGIAYRGWLPNHRVPALLAKSKLTIHVPRRPYAETMPGIPTIRMFEALACGIPLISAPWRDIEGLFPAGAYVSVQDSAAMTRALRELIDDPDYARTIADAGLHAVQTRHTCAHRAHELLTILASIKPAASARRLSDHSHQAVCVP